jgi:hypothetical protein
MIEQPGKTSTVSVTGDGSDEKMDGCSLLAILIS